VLETFTHIVRLGAVQAPLAFYKLCREVYTGVGYRQLQSDECVFVRYEVNVEKGSKTAKELRTLTTLADLKVIPEEDRVLLSSPPKAVTKAKEVN
jgi:hypothetical protein